MKWVVAWVGLCLLLTACHPSEHGTLSGQLFAVGGDAPGSPSPLNGTVTIAGEGKSTMASVGRDGRFSITLPPGRYQLTGVSPLFGEGKYTCRAAKPTTVRADATIVANVYCQEI